MTNDADGSVLPGVPAEQAQAITLDEAADIASEVRELIEAGQEHRAWERVRRLHPADIGMIVAGLPRTSRDTMLRVMSPETVAWMLRQMNPIEAGRVGTRLGARVLTPVLGQLHPQQAFDTLRRLPLRTARDLASILPRAGEESETVLLEHPPDTAGSLMVDRYPSAAIDGTAEAARASLRALDEDRGRFTLVFVMDGDHLAGQVEMVDLALADTGTPLRELATPVVATVAPDTPAEECARLQRHYNLTQLPVLDDEARLIGVVPAESLLSATIEQDTRQMLRVASVSGETVDGPLAASVRTRLPWLTANLGTTFLAAATIALFESTLARVVVLAAFLPVVAGQGGIAGTQSLTLLVRSMALGELVGVGARRLLVREVLLGLVHGVWLGLLVAAIAVVWQGSPGLGVVLGIAMLGNMLIAGAVGAGVPLLLRRIGIDPAVASAVIVTTATDVFGFLLFLGVATALIELIE